MDSLKINFRNGYSVFDFCRSKPDIKMEPSSGRPVDYQVGEGRHKGVKSGLHFYLKGYSVHVDVCVYSCVFFILYLC